MPTKLWALGALSLLPMCLAPHAVLAESADGSAAPSQSPAAAADSLVRETVTWDAAAGGATSDAQCRDVPEWEAQQRDWMGRTADWCSLEVRFRYGGSLGDIRMVVSKEDGNARRTPLLHASVDLPGNGDQTSPYQFIFPCPPAPAERLCLSYEATTDARELSYDFLDLGVNEMPVIEDFFVRQIVSPYPADLEQREADATEAPEAPEATEAPEASGIDARETGAGEAEASGIDSRAIASSTVAANASGTSYRAQGAPDRVPYRPPLVTLADAETEAVQLSDLRRDLRRHFDSLGDVELMKPLPAPIDQLRKRP